ncbi:bifunctional methylenetetrahydrofolate dehydrogenase/methenyltetrahydrofolate cyclohydrolase [Weissella diestrammenae]|uniref:Bifunctional protein FolD n=1 Tax=Weissella diestrammenae TaxID=1162633 RepID=A0A7G9T4B2_9LACO|nr:tetrahydrofolate dehydrogenase/cyclohydrolase catalytic domain-containing protein [Weissella diestrammenae]MCM0583469.1 bifunctional methylenetetrahydrofolate dehydrogenase/methenyltetrahydrofolate cyclohydrolase [Weissella diestrammenae]QNN74937.1 bifunctional methylenetetrahydrofolate dehydrogenase/methenyltetrahydrofolate cyclohydrolase [Weissella diestrammenae]
MAEIIDGKAIAQLVRQKLAEQVEVLKTKSIVPGLTVIIVGDDPASQIYVRNKERAAQKVGIAHQTIRLAADVTEASLLTIIKKLNQDDQVDAILVQSPLPNHLNEQLVQETISPEKDVDGFNPINIGKLYANRHEYYPVANTPKGVMTLLMAHHVPLRGKLAVVVGRSILVGKPMLSLLEAANASVALLHRYTPDDLRRSLLKQADIVIVGTGIPGLVVGDDLKSGATVIDVGINRLSDGQLVGDVDFASAQAVAGAITPVPGGVGPMTIATLLQTTVELAAQHHQIELADKWQII